MCAIKTGIKQYIKNMKLTEVDTNEGYRQRGVMSTNLFNVFIDEIMPSKI